MAFDFYQGCTATEIQSGTGSVQAVEPSEHLRFMGFSCRENDGAPAEFIIRNGVAPEGEDPLPPAVAFVRLVEDETARDMFLECGINCPDGIFIERVSGESHIVIFSKQ